MNNLIPQWLDLDSAVHHLANKKITISKLLEFGGIGDLPMYVLIDKSFTIKFWDMRSKPPILKSQEITDFLPISKDQIQKIQKMYPASGYSISIEARLPEGCSYDLPDSYPILMRMESKHLSRGKIIKSLKEIRVLARELEELKGVQVILSKADRSAMAKPINDIRKQSDEPNNNIVIWEALKALALSKNPPPPILGYTDEGIQFRGAMFDESGEPDIYTNSAFRGYMLRHPYP